MDQCGQEINFGLQEIIQKYTCQSQECYSNSSSLLSLQTGKTLSGNNLSLISLCVAVSISSWSTRIDSRSLQADHRRMFEYLFTAPEKRRCGTASPPRRLFTMIFPFFSLIECGAFLSGCPAIQSELSGPTFVTGSISPKVLS